MSTAAWSRPHHDGSSTHVPEPDARLGGSVDVLRRVPRGSDVQRAWLRVINDGEPELVSVRIDRQDASDTWYRATLPVVNPVVSYRFLVDGGEHGYQWLNGVGLHSRDVADAADFRLSTFGPPPDWATGTTYQVFPDRFAKSMDRAAPAWARHAPVRLPVSVLVRALEGLAGTPDLQADADGWFTLPADGPAFTRWRI